MSMRTLPAASVACWLLGSLFCHAETLEETRAKRELGGASSMVTLGVTYACGQGVPKDDIEAVKWYRKAADQGYTDGQFRLGLSYYDGLGVPKDDIEAVKRIRKAADQGEMGAQNFLGYCYEKGQIVVKDEAEAAKWYRKSADQGNVTAQNNLGVCYELGRGVVKDAVEAVKWYRMAAQRGEADAQANLARLSDSREGNTKEGPAEPNQSNNGSGVRVFAPTLPTLRSEKPGDKTKGGMPATPTADLAGWDVVHYQDREYVSSVSIHRFYRFAEHKVEGDAVRFISPTLIMRGTVGSQDLMMNNIKFVMSYPLEKVNGKILISRVDLSKLIDPVLRPSYIGSASSSDTVIIDAGHGGHDSGARGIYGDEKDFTLRLALELKADLEKRGLKVAMTRKDDTFISPGDRVEFANEIPNGIFVSLQFNSGASDLAGIETLALAPQGTSTESDRKEDEDQIGFQGNQRDSENIALATAVHAAVVHHFKMVDRGVRRARLDVLKGLKCPGVMFLGGCVTDPNDAQLIAAGKFREELAHTIGEAIMNYRRALKPVARGAPASPTAISRPPKADESSELFSATGFFISQDGYVVTNHHVIAKGAHVSIVAGGVSLAATVVKSDATSDLAILKVNGQFAALPVSTSGSVKLGDTVATVGFPNIDLQGLSPKLAKGEIGSLTGVLDDPLKFQISVPVQPGNSGGALVDERGNVVGVVSGKLSQKAALAASGTLAENVNYAVKSSVLLEFLKSLPDISARLKAPRIEERKFSDVVSDAEKAAVMVLVD